MRIANGGSILEPIRSQEGDWKAFVRGESGLAMVSGNVVRIALAGSNIPAAGFEANSMRRMKQSNMRCLWRGRCQSQWSCGCPGQSWRPLFYDGYVMPKLLIGGSSAARQ
jgi:hypothetical protein